MEKITIQDLLQSGVHFGHQTYRWNPKMKPYVFGKRHGVTIFDLTVTIRKLAEACNFLREVTAEGGNVLFVGTKRQCKALMRQAAEETDMFHMTDRWLGGTLTNNKVIMTRVKRLKELRKMNEDGSLENMPNKEEAEARRELRKLETTLGGIVGMPKLPDVMVVADIENDDIAVREADKKGIPVVAIVDSNCDPNAVDYPIPGNDDAVRSLKVLVNSLKSAILEGHTQASKEDSESKEAATEVTPEEMKQNQESTSAEEKTATDDQSQAETEKESTAASETGQTAETANPEEQPAAEKQE